MFARAALRRPALTFFTGTLTTTAITVTTYLNTDSGLGLKRELDFWSAVTPVVWDYWWHCGENSPKAWWNKDGRDEHVQKEEKRVLLNNLHQRNAPKIYQVMLQLGGLYIKLGQVLSVTAIPIPELYREHFRTLQSNVPNHEDFTEFILPTLQDELGNVHDIFDNIEEMPCGAASIGQAHRATLKESGEDVIIKVQYPNAVWQVPADIECVGDLLKLCVFFGVVDESASKLGYEEFARQFLSELDYVNEMQNLTEVHASSLDPKAPYLTNGVVLPHVFGELCTKRVITMSYLKGEKFEEETKRQLSLLGIAPKKQKNMYAMIRESGGRLTNDRESNTALALSSANTSWRSTLSNCITNFISVDFLFSLARFGRRLALWSQNATANAIRLASALYIVPTDWKEWADTKQASVLQSARLDWTKDAVDALLDVHGYQILNQGLFNADPHPGNILVDFPADSNSKPVIGLIDYGQCKRLSPSERVQIARLILSIAEKESDQVIAQHFRSLGVKTKNDSTRFLADFGRLMFGSFEAKHLDKTWHKELHKEDRVLYFPKELSMVYRTALLLRGLAMSLQFNPSVSEVWKHHAVKAIDEHGC